MNSTIILASGSPRRRQLLSELGFSFSVQSSEVEELDDMSMGARALCEQNAYLKARDVATRNCGALVLGADTLVFVDEIPLGKPKSKAQAKEYLRLLSGREHCVCTGICLIRDSLEKRYSEVTAVRFKTLEESVIEHYIEAVEVLDKAGGYAIQDSSEMIIERIRGDYSNVVGLPQQLVKRAIEEFLLQNSAN